MSGKVVIGMEIGTMGDREIDILLRDGDEVYFEDGQRCIFTARWSAGRWEIFIPTIGRWVDVKRIREVLD